MEVQEILQSQDEYLSGVNARSIKYRIKKLKTLKRTIALHENDIMQALYDDFYKPNYETLAAELFTVHKEIKCFIDNLGEWSSPENVTPSLLNFPSSEKIYHEAYGKVLIISPWNYPFQLAIMPMIGAFASGNAVVLKPSRFTAHTANIIETICHTVFDQHEVVVCKGGVDTSQQLLEEKWDHIFFTGSTAVGKIVAKKAAEHLTPTTLELGGKNPCIVDETADLKLAAKRIAWGKWLNAGQTCIAPDTVLVQENVKDDLIKHLKSWVKKFYPDTLEESHDLTGIINEKHFKRLVELKEENKVLFGGDINEEKKKIAPTLIDEPSMESTIMQQEIFGPLLPIISYESDEALKRLTDHFYQPLAYFIFTRNKKKAKQWMREKQFGGGVINDSIIHVINEKLPFGGVGNSGMGQYHGYYSFKTFTREKAIVDHKIWYDQPFRYPPYKGKLGLLKKLKRWIT
jgi:aldehyde dehydrogenase (NAD+)